MSLACLQLSFCPRHWLSCHLACPFSSAHVASGDLLPLSVGPWRGLESPVPRNENAPCPRVWKTTHGGPLSPSSPRLLPPLVLPGKPSLHTAFLTSPFPPDGAPSVQSNPALVPGALLGRGRRCPQGLSVLSGRRPSCGEGWAPARAPAQPPASAGPWE